jgi:hypothetical protein
MIDSPAGRSGPGVTVIESPAGRSGSGATVIKTPTGRFRSGVTMIDNPAGRSGPGVTVIETPTGRFRSGVTMIETPAGRSGSGATVIDTPAGGFGSGATVIASPTGSSGHHATVIETAAGGSGRAAALLLDESALVGPRAGTPDEEGGHDGAVAGQTGSLGDGPAEAHGVYSRPVGNLDQFAKETFDQETPNVTHGAAAWQIPPELGMAEVRLDGLLVVRDPAVLATLAPPWPLAVGADEICIEVKMQGDHTDRRAVERAALRCQARLVQRLEDTKAPWDGEQHLWMVAPHVSAHLSERRALERVGPGCYRVGPSSFPFLWIAANELPLADELVPFLVARTGRPLDAFVDWVKTRRPIEWLLRVLEYLPMSSAARESLQSYVFPKTDDPVIRARQRMIAEWALESAPDVREAVLAQGRREGVDEGRLDDARSSLRDILTVRGLVLSADDEARVDACTDLDTLRRWRRQAVVAATTADALR